MDFEREDSPPPAYSESDYDKKHSSTIQFLAITEEIEEEEWDDSRSEDALSSGAQGPVPSVRMPSTHPHQPSSATTSRRAARRLPVPPHEAVANDTKPLRIHKKSASHSYVLPSSPKLENRAQSPVASSPLASYSSQHRFSGPKSDHLYPQSPPTSPLISSFPARTASHTRAVSVSQLNFDASVAYNRPEYYSPVSAGTTRSEPSYHRQQQHTFSPNALYNSAVSSHLHSSPVPSRLNNPHTPSPRSASPQPSGALFTVARPPQTTWMPPVITSAQRSQSPSSVSYSASATQFPLTPSRIMVTNPTQTAHDRWATSEHQFVHN
ncbi:hypothetical protein J3R30DRAFT_3479683 [Lentinula aciculospora]|uniref:Uncharacterized protein n=1 Tax=Lentinula aciculospora TaxID=153920 RepID=A0A9W9DN12_9AGAR|nr:hypothetical protein J3R30DRAFT_3479683 [Lentinula aciculospora]